jgi:NADH-quinone oxidoreductase subunit G
VYFLKRQGKGDDFLISDDPYPNCTGAKILRLSIAENTHSDLCKLYEMIENGTYRNIICVYEDLFAEQVDVGIFANVSVTYIGYRKSRTAEFADFAFPVKTIFERDGTFVNKDYILQKFFKAVPPPSKFIFECWEILSILANIYHHSEENENLTIDQIWKDLSYTVDCFKNIDFNNVELDGILIKKS